jgi:hypothetical protein
MSSPVLAVKEEFNTETAFLGIIKNILEIILRDSFQLPKCFKERWVG